MKDNRLASHYIRCVLRNLEGRSACMPESLKIGYISAIVDVRRLLNEAGFDVHKVQGESESE